MNIINNNFKNNLTYESVLLFTSQAKYGICENGVVVFMKQSKLSVDWKFTSANAINFVGG